MDRNKMTEPPRRSVTRPRERPLGEDVLAVMEPGEPFTVAELVEILSDHDPSTATVRNRLEELVDDGEVLKKSHSDRVVTYRRPKS